MGQKAEYRSAIRSRRLIREAFLQLLKEKDLNRITVTDIVNRADINRATFYAHYPDVHGVISEIENEIIDKLMMVLRDFKFKSFFKDPAAMLLKVNRYLEEDVEFYRTLIMANGSEIFLERMKHIFSDYMRNDTDVPEEIQNSEAFPLRICYFAGGIVNMYKQWFLGNLNCSLNDISIEVGRIIAASARDLVGVGKQEDIF